VGVIRLRTCLIEKLAFLLLPLLAVSNLYLVLRDKRVYAQFKGCTETEQRQRLFRRWSFESLVFYGCVPLACLIATGHLNSLVQFPSFLFPFSDALSNELESENGGFIHGMITTIATLIIPFLLLGLTLISLGRAYSDYRTNTDSIQAALLESRNIQYLIPRNRHERCWTTVLSIVAGVTEELCFRLVLPILIFIVTGSGLLAVILSTIWFGLVHFYQGWIGILATLLVGAIMMFVYVLTQNIWLVMLIHTVIDLNDLSFAPWFAEWLGKRRITKIKK